MSGGYVRQSAASIVTGLIVAAAPVNAELNAIQTAFSAVTGVGHAHDGTTGGGAPIDPSIALLPGHYVSLGNGGTNNDLSMATAGSSLIMGATGFVSVKNNFLGIAPPTVANDSSQGYQITSLWLDTVGLNLYICASPVVGAALWINITTAAGIASLLGKLYNSSADTAIGYLTSKLKANTLLTTTTINAGGNEYTLIGPAAYVVSGTNTYSITPSPSITAYSSGQAFLTIFTNGNNGSCTLNVNGVGAQSLLKYGNVSLIAGDIPAGHVGLVVYDGAEFQLLNPAQNKVAYTATGTNTYSVTAAPVPTAYISGQTWSVIFTNGNTGPVTINFNSLGPKAITKNGSVALAPGDIPSGYAATITYDGTEFQITPQVPAISIPMVYALTQI